MGEENLFSNYPDQIRSSSERPDVRYLRLPGHFAIHGEVPGGLRSSVELLLDDGRIAVCRGEPGDQPATAKSVVVTPVYSLGPKGPPVVPTGLVFVRFKEGVRVEERGEILSRAGYTVTQALSYAPHAAWVRASSGGVAEALSGIANLEALPDVVNVEPQMLGERVRR